MTDQTARGEKCRKWKMMDQIQVLRIIPLSQCMTSNSAIAERPRLLAFMYCVGR